MKYWGYCCTFFRSERAIREFGRYFEVLGVRPKDESDHHTALILRK
jgi:hypothetical protein